MVKDRLTARQREILEYIERMVTESGRAPTIREIGEQFDISSTNGVRTHLEALTKKGYIARQSLISRGIELVRRIPGEMAARFRTVPLVGSVPAGVPLTAVENREDFYAVDESFLPSGETFTLRVVGDSMIDAGIYDGDLVLVKKQDDAEPGDIVVAVIGEEATVKRYFPERGIVRLQPANERYTPIMVDADAPGFYIAGKVVGLMRRF